jgi:hypothetical protein
MRRDVPAGSPAGIRSVRPTGCAQATQDTSLDSVPLDCGPTNRQRAQSAAVRSVLGTCTPPGPLPSVPQPNGLDCIPGDRCLTTTPVPGQCPCTPSATFARNVSPHAPR